MIFVYLLDYIHMYKNLKSNKIPLKIPVSSLYDQPPPKIVLVV